MCNRKMRGLLRCIPIFRGLYFLVSLEKRDQGMRGLDLTLSPALDRCELHQF